MNRPCKDEIVSTAEPNDWICCVEGQRVYLTGLKPLLQEFRLAEKFPSVETACEMLERLMIHNSIPDGACETYVFALLHAYERFLIEQNNK